MQPANQLRLIHFMLKLRLWKVSARLMQKDVEPRRLWGARWLFRRVLKNQIVDDRWHPPRCPANHFHRTRLVWETCTCGSAFLKEPIIPYRLSDTVDSTAYALGLNPGKRLTDVFPDGIWASGAPLIITGGNAGGGKTQRQSSGLRRSLIVTVDRVPDWMQSGDVICQRGRKTYARALNRTEPRYRAILRRLRRFFK